MIYQKDVNHGDLVLFYFSEKGMGTNDVVPVSGTRMATKSLIFMVNLGVTKRIHEIFKLYFHRLYQ